ncbi:hypothetical protein TSOC_010134 [Tetrabaena socialis]|uniref:Uncharacterized protein n=1 Tax=Tetrabaena socialis TaxID=47790 RepID=A0A2J7ZU68_9CHLO|nr:hypothetical protein TSOC_010134 [Tetrabaena socialis]|eukprot:PNH03780.1 hypothetical protein TSOC_010134 [Tetrabaena socialis]
MKYTPRLKPRLGGHQPASSALLGTPGTQGGRPRNEDQPQHSNDAVRDKPKGAATDTSPLDSTPARAAVSPHGTAAPSVVVTTSRAAASASPVATTTASPVAATAGAAAASPVAAAAAAAAASPVAAAAAASPVAAAAAASPVAAAPAPTLDWFVARMGAKGAAPHQRAATIMWTDLTAPKSHMQVMQDVKAAPHRCHAGFKATTGPRTHLCTSASVIQGPLKPAVLSR